MNERPTPRETLAEPIRVEMVEGQIRAESAPAGSPRWAYLEGQRVAERVLATIDLAALVEQRAELAAHTLVMMRAERLKHHGVTYETLINWKAGVRAAVDAAWKAAVAR
jgi:hypothetical protein